MHIQYTDIQTCTYTYTQTYTLPNEYYLIKEVIQNLQVTIALCYVRSRTQQLLQLSQFVSDSA